MAVCVERPLPAALLGRLLHVLPPPCLARMSCPVDAGGVLLAVPVMVRKPRPDRCWNSGAPGWQPLSWSAMVSARSMEPTDRMRLATSPCCSMRCMMVQQQQAPYVR